MADGSSFESKCHALLGERGRRGESERFQELLELDWKKRMEECPEEATYLGYSGYDDKWTDLSFDAISQRKQTPKAIIEVLNSIDKGQLGEDDQLSYDLLKREKENLVTLQWEDLDQAILVDKNHQASSSSHGVLEA